MNDLPSTLCPPCDAVMRDTLDVPAITRRFRKYFTSVETMCPCGCAGDDMDLLFMRSITALREVVALPFRVSSAYRCERHNADVGGKEYSNHLSGRAMDISICGDEYMMQRILFFSGHTGINGVIYYKTRGFVHLDNRISTYFSVIY